MTGCRSSSKCFTFVTDVYTFIRLVCVFWRNIATVIFSTITKTCIHNFDPLKPHFYIDEADLTSTHNILVCFEQKYEKLSEFLYENFQFLGVKFSIYLNRRVFVNGFVIWIFRTLLVLESQITIAAFSSVEKYKCKHLQVRIT